MSRTVRILLVSGSTRAASTNTAVLATARDVAPADVTAELYDGLSELPAFNPDDDGDRVPRAVAELRRALAASDAVLFCTPEYAGTLPGSLKNLLDWTVGGGELNGKPVAWLNVAGEVRGERAVATLALVLGYVGAVVIDEASVRLSVSRDAVGADRRIANAGVRAELRKVLAEIVRYARTATAG